jgi:hypothetical protein
MNSIHRSILARSLMTGVALLAMTTMRAGEVRAESVILQGADGANGANAVNSGDDGMTGDNGESVTANAGSVLPVTFPQNQGTATGGSGGAGGNGTFDHGDGFGGSGGNGGTATATASTAIPAGSGEASGNSFGGNGGAGGNGELFGFGSGGNGGNGGTATATAGTTVISGTTEANANAHGGAGGSNGSGGESGGDGTPGQGGSATATSTAMTTLSGAANSSANATGGTGGPSVISEGPPPGSGGGGGANAESTAVSGLSGDATSSSTATGGAGNAVVGPGGDASASSAATSNGSGNALSSASATGGDYGQAFPVTAGDATAVANAFATVGGTATAKAIALGGTFLGFIEPGVAANATSTATTVRGALAQAQSTALGSSGQAQSTATTSFAGVSVQSSAVAPTAGDTATTNAIAQGGSGQAFVNPGQTAYAFSTAQPDKAYAASLIGGASDVASALLGPRDAVFGTAILGANYASDGGGESETYSASSTFDFGYPGDLQLGLIDDQQSGFANGLGFQSMEFTIQADGVDVLDVTFGSLAIAESFFRDDVIDLGSNLGPDIDLTFGYTLIADGSGGFGFDLAIGGAVPEPSTWAMMLAGFAGLGFAGYRRAREPRAA